MSGKLSALQWLTILGVAIIGLNVAAPFAFKAGGDYGFVAAALPAALLAIPATAAAERVSTRALWGIIAVAVALRLYALSFPPLLSTDIYRYIWDGEVQAAGINPYRYVPADPALAALRDAAIYPHINRADYAPTIYQPVAQFFFYLVTRLGANTIAMRLGLLLCEALSIALLIAILRRIRRPPGRIVAWLWHPLPIWEIGNSGHVDALMLCMMLAGIWLVLTGRAIRGAVALALAALVKPFVLPALAAMWRPWNWKMVLAAVVTAALCYAPYLSVGKGVLGFLAGGYLSEEGISSGDGLWLLSLWRLAFGAHAGDVFGYGAFAAAIMLLLAVRIWRNPVATAGATLAGMNMLLLAFLLLLSPEYEWYFLLVLPFVVLCGNAASWAATIGAILLTNEVETDFHISTMLVHSVIFGAVLAAAVWPMRSAKEQMA